jgi:lipoprotein-anchoring transpeptidase ErfK/SrfK
VRSLSTLFLLAFLIITFGATAQPLRAATLNGLVTPVADSALQGLVEVTDIAEHATFRKWQLDLLINGDEKQAAFLAVGEKRQTEAGLLTLLDTTLYPNGQHRLRLRVVHSNLNYDEHFTSIIIDNPNAPEPLPNPEQPTEQPTDPAVLKPELIAPLGQGVPDGRRWIEVDLSDQTLIAWQGETAVLRTSISSGRTEYPTVRGTYKIRTKLDLERMIGPGYDTPNVPWTMYFFRGYAIHGAYWHNNFGTPVSHGCVNMRVEEAKALYEWASVGLEVVVHE